MDDDKDEDIVDWVIVVCAALAAVAMFSLAILLGVRSDMDAQQALAIMDAMAQKIESLTERIDVLEKKLEEQCSDKVWVNDLRPGVVIPSIDDGPYLTQEELNGLMESMS